MIQQENKIADVEHEVNELIRKRWSPRSFSEKAIDQTTISQIFEGARWAASAFNEQPWQYVYAHRGTKGFDQLWDCLMPGNQPWTKSAAVLFVAMVRKQYAKNGKDNHWAEHDLGLANGQLLMQAMDLDVYGHLMAGFDQGKVTEILNLDNSIKPVCMGALGYLGSPEKLEEPLRSRETAKRTRNPIHTFIKEL